MNNVNEKESDFSFKQTHGGRSPFPGGDWGESSEFQHETEAQRELDLAETLLSGDEKIHDAVLAAFESSPTVEASDYRISVSDSVVTLEGTVRTNTIREEAVSLASRTAGVSEVVNEIKLGGNL